MDYLLYHKMINIHKDLIRSLQYIHDNHFPEVWEDKFKLTAERYNLIYTPENQ